MLTRPRTHFVDSPRRGVALLVTIILLSFLVLLMVALSSLVRVETKIAGNNASLAQARQNALMGLNVALGKLQETAGPDQRVTARADIIAPSFTRQYQMNLTGVWDTNGAAPNLVTWLINGNEDLDGKAPNIDPDGSPSADKTQSTTLLLNAASDLNNNSGNPSSSPLYDDANPPARVFNPASSAPNFRFGDGHVYLVGNGAVDVSSTVTNTIVGKSYKHAISERVIVRKTPIIVDGAKVAGKAPGTDVTIGHYAYWVGDAGIKASLSAGNRLDQVDYDDSGSDGTDYKAAGYVATNQQYVNLKVLNQLQLQGNRLDMLFQPDPGVLDIFSPGNVPAFVKVNGSTVSSADRRDLYGVLSHPFAIDNIRGLFESNQLQNTISDTPFANPGLTGIPSRTIKASADDFKAVINQRLKQGFHDITPQNFSVLTNMVSGGLKHDLGFLAAEKFANLAGYNTAVTKMNLTASKKTELDNLISGAEVYANVWRVTYNTSSPSKPLGTANAQDLLQQTFPIIPPAPAAFTAGPEETSFPLVPVISEFSLNLVPTVDGSGNVKVAVEGLVELWNPYNAQMELPNGKTLQISIPVEDTSVSPTERRMKDVVLKDSSSALTVSMDVARTLGWNGSDPNILLDLVGDSLHSNTTPPALPTWPPGTSTRWKITKGSIDALDSTATKLSGFPLSATLDVSTVVGNSRFPVRLVYKTSAEELYLVSELNFGQNTTPVSGGDITYGFRLNDEIDYAAGTEKWLGRSDPRGPISNQDTTGVTTYTLSPILAAVGVPQLDTAVQVLYNETHVPPGKVVLFDMPRQEILGVAALRAVAYAPPSGTTNSPAYRIGSPNTTAVAYNSVFEDYFVSSVPRSNTWSPKSGAPLANTAMTVYDVAPNGNTSDANLLAKLHSQDSAEYILVRDTLNVNSTSVAAWRAILGGALSIVYDSAKPNTSESLVWDTATNEMSLDWRYYLGTVTKKAEIKNAFFRFPHTAANIGADYYTDATTGLRSDLLGTNQVNRDRAAFQLGLRELTRSQVESLAQQVVFRIKNPPAGSTRPFKSVTQFIDEGVLKYAIDNATPSINRPNAAIASDISSSAPAYLTQGDMLELIGHRLVARSDTFIIRTYGDVNDPDALGAGKPKVTARVWLEATVQRLPQKHPTADDPNDNMKPTFNGTGTEVGNFGRQFKVIKMRWLRPEDV